MSILRIKKNDVVVAMSGVSAGKTGKVLQVMQARSRAVVEGLNLVKKCVKKSNDKPQGAIIEKEGSISLSSLMLYCANCKKGVKIRRARENGRSMRMCKRCGHAFDV